MSEPSDALRDAFIAGAQWADNTCPVHSYPKLLAAEAAKRYPTTSTTKTECWCNGRKILCAPTCVKWKG